MIKTHKTDARRFRTNHYRAQGVLLLILVAALTGCTTATPGSSETSGPASAETPAPESSPKPVEGKAEGPILFIPMEGVDKNALASLAAQFEKKLKLDIQVLNTKGELPEEFTAKGSLNRERKQLRGAEFLERLMPYTESDSRNPLLPEGNLGKYKVIIAVTDQDLYNDKRPEREFLFSVGTQSQRGYRLGVVSEKRLDPAFYGKKPEAKVAQARLRKLLLKQIGRLYYGKPGSDDPTNLMYSGINSVEDVDRLKEGF